jgi:hypothetical protein
MESAPDFKSMIEAIECPVHKRHPKIIFQEDNGIKLSCCCVEFNTQCFYILKKLLAGQTIESAVTQWKNNRKK